MATVLQTLSLALAKLGMAGRNPTSDDLAALQGYYDGLVFSGAFGRMRDLYATDSYTMREMDRASYDNSAVATATFPDTYDYSCFEERPSGAGVSANLRRPHDLVVGSVNEQETTVTYLFDAELGRWIKLNSLALTDTAPLSNRNGDGLACVIATKIEAFYPGCRLTPMTMRSALSFSSALTHKSGSPARAVAYDFF